MSPAKDFMAYRGIDTARMAYQSLYLYSQVGQTAVWRKYVSASAGVAAAGESDTLYYHHHVITGMFGNRVVEQLPEHSTPGGMVAAAQVYVITREQVSRQDELVWNGIAYRAESDPVRATLVGHWVTVLKRAGA